MSVMVILEMDGDPDALLAAAADLEARRPTSAVTARVIAPMEGGVIMCTVWESAAARVESQPIGADNCASRRRRAEYRDHS